MPAKRETVYERYQRVGYVVGEDHPVARANRGAAPKPQEKPAPKVQKAGPAD